MLLTWCRRRQSWGAMHCRLSVWAGSSGPQPVPLRARTSLLPELDPKGPTSAVSGKRNDSLGPFGCGSVGVILTSWRHGFRCEKSAVAMEWTSPNPTLGHCSAHSPSSVSDASRSGSAQGPLWCHDNPSHLESMLQFAKHFSQPSDHITLPTKPRVGVITINGQISHLRVDLLKATPTSNCGRAEPKLHDPYCPA